MAMGSGDCPAAALCPDVLACMRLRCPFPLATTCGERSLPVADRKERPTMVAGLTAARARRPRSAAAWRLPVALAAELDVAASTELLLRVAAGGVDTAVGEGSCGRGRREVGEGGGEVQGEVDDVGILARRGRRGMHSCSVAAGVATDVERGQGRGDREGRRFLSAQAPAADEGRRHG